VITQLLPQFLAVVAFIGAARDPAPARDLLHHRQSRLRLENQIALGFLPDEPRSPYSQKQAIPPLRKSSLPVLRSEPIPKRR
jgi:hypothetical protein